MKQLAIILLSLCYVFGLNAQGVEELYQKGNEHYQQGDYVEAIKQYEAIIAKGYEGEDIYFNLGNAYYKDNQLAPAILNYERAQKMAPGNEDIDFNLRIANLQVSDRISSEPDFVLIQWWKSFLVGRSTNGWAKLSIVFIWLAFVLSIAFIFVNSTAIKRLSFFASIGLLVIGAACLALSYQQLHYDKDIREGIVFATNVYVKSEPSTESTDLFILREGTKVNIVRSEQNWYQIKLSDGKVGWLPTEKMEVI